jgi:hypothetical protein
MRHGADSPIRLTRAVARYIAGPRPTGDDLADAADAIADYRDWRDCAAGFEGGAELAGVLRRAITERHRFKESS